MSNGNDVSVYGYNISRVGNTDVLTRLAEAQALDGAIDEALDTMELALKENAEELVLRPNALRYRGTLRLKVGQSELAEADFLDAIAMAKDERRRHGNCARR